MAHLSRPMMRRPARSGPTRGSSGKVREVVGWFFLWTSGIHVGLVAADPSIYEHFADAAVMGWVERGWRGIFMGHPLVWGLALSVGELAIGLLLLRGGTSAKIGWIGVIGFHVALTLFGWGFLIWSVPALGVLVPVAWRDWPGLTPREPPRRTR